MFLAAASILLAAASDPPSRGASRDRDEVEIRNLQARQAEAWNRHDATAYADLFTEDGDVSLARASRPRPCRRLRASG